MSLKIKTFILCFITISTIRAQNVDWVYSTNDGRWQKEKSLKLEKRLGSVNPDIEISDEQAQYIDGFGGCFNEKGWDALMTLSEKARTQVMEDLFGPEGSNFSYCRLPIGASDYGLSPYTLNDVADDFKMINFSISRDRYILIPFVRAAQKAHPGLKFWASPWTPPAWMKTNNHYACNMDENGKDYNGLAREFITELPTTAFKMQRGYLEAYALYLSKYVNAYEAEGIPIEALHVQNEPCSNQKFPSCNWRPEDLAYFIGEFLGPRFETDKVKTAIYFGTINRGNPDFFRVALNDKKAAKYIRGVGFQWEGKYAIPTISREYPSLKMVQTESECGGGENNWYSAEHTWDQINHYLKNGASSYAYWNMVLDTPGESTWGWIQNSLVSIDKKSGSIVYNPEFYVMKHLSRFVVPGAHLLKSTNADNHLAFVNPDGSMVLIAVNKEDKDKTVTFGIKGQVLKLSMKAKSFNTVCLKASNKK